MYIQVYTWTSFVGAVLWLSCILWTQIALEKELGTCIPTVLQVNIKMILLNAVRIWWNYNNRVLRIPTMYISDDLAYILVYTNIYINIPWIIAYLGIKAMKPFCLGRRGTHWRVPPAGWSTWCDHPVQPFAFSCADRGRLPWSRTLVYWAFPSKNLPIASSIPARSGLTKNSSSSGHGKGSPSTGSCSTGGWDASSIAASRCPPRKPVTGYD